MLPAGACLVHVGYHKTASTFLQHQLFADTTTGFAPVLSGQESLELFVEPLRWEFDGPALKALIGQRVQALPTGAVPVITQERLGGHFVSGGEDAAELADRVAAAVPEGRVLLVIREQRALIRSCYSEYIHQGGTASLRTFLTAPGPRHNVLPWFRHGYFEYDGLISQYHRLFGPDRVLVLAMEQLARDPTSFLGEVARFCGARVPARPEASPGRPGRHGLTLVIERGVNRLFATTKLGPAPLVPLPDGYWRTRRFAAHADRLIPPRMASPVDRRIKAVIAAATQGRYEASNRRTAALTNLDLPALGYPC